MIYFVSLHRFEKIAMKKHFISIISVLGLMAAISIQIIWLYNSYLFIKSDLTIRLTQMLELAINEETWSRMEQVQIGQYVEGREKEDRGSNLAEFVYLQESLEKLNLPISLDTVNVFLIKILEEKGFPTDIELSIYKRDTLITEVGKCNEHLFNLRTHDVPLREDYSIVARGQLSNSGILYYKRMGILFASTIFLMVFVVGCIILQVQTIRKQKRMAKMREDFSYAMIHDMKMPLSTIAMVLDFWDKGKLDGKPEMERKYCLIAEEETQHLLALANKVLTISKLENDKLEMNKAWVKLTPLLEKLMERFAAKATKKVNFVTDLKSDEVYADEEYLEEVLGNLIDNSIKYSDEEVTIRICSEEERNGCTISVRDDGWGISPKSQRVIFEKFERGDMLVKRHKKRVAGFGLGLNFVWQVVDAHGGRVALDSVEREYTEFELHFPKEGTDDMGND